jgi:hypothetical protein
MRTDLVTVIEDKAHGAAMRTLAVMEALPLTHREASLLDIAIRAGIKASLETLADGEFPV